MGPAMAKMDEYRAQLRALDEWDDFLLRESGLPGPRGNIELAQVVADEGDPALFERYLAYTADRAPTNSPYEFLAFCGAVGIGRLIAGGANGDLWAILRECATDPRWRMREAAAMALQQAGEADMEQLMAEMEEWSRGTPLEQRAAAAGLCEPRLLAKAEDARKVLRILDRITASISGREDRHGEEFQALRKGLGYCWSVAVVALPAEGKAVMEKWLVEPDRDIRWIMRQNLKKARLARMDAEWVEEWLGQIGG